MFTTIKRWLGIEERAEIKEQQKVEEIDAERIRIADEEEDPAIEELLNRVWNTGKPHIATKDEEGNLEIREVEQHED